jgi:PPK2 family polyphosphate:nucleotide phosphotransferase
VHVRAVSPNYSDGNDKETIMSYALRLKDQHRIKLKDCDPRDDAGLKRDEAETKTAQLIDELIELQELLYAARLQSLVVILQGRDTSGKDGTIRHVVGPLNSQSCSVSSFKAPTGEELAHDFLWRIHAQTPAAGYIRIFNRSHYEDVLVVRVHELVPEKIWSQRYEHINAFERLLSDSGTIILKFYLHISKDEQEQRLIEREKNPINSWKLSVDDWKERDHWDDYTAAYEDALNRCSTKRAPWFIVPADKKWFRNLAVAETLRDALIPFKETWLEKLQEVGREERKAIDEYRRNHKHRE